jgi:septum site-determining protein MinD
MMNKDDILEILAIPLIGMVPDHEDVIVSANRGMPAVFDEKSIVGEAYRRIARRVNGEKDIPFVALEEPDTFWSVMKRWIGLAPSKEVAQ